MAQLFEVKEIDRRTYEEELKDFLPLRMIDVHVHVYLARLQKAIDSGRTVTWPRLVAAESPIEELQETYRLMFPGKEVIPVPMSVYKRGDDLEALNAYTSEAAARNGYPAFIYAPPEWSGEELEENVMAGGFVGVKVYLDLSPDYIPVSEIRIFDFLPHHFLEVINRNRWIAMLHIPRHGRLGDPVNLAQMLEIEEKYPDVKLIIAHVGRAYCEEDAGNAFNAS